MGENTEDRLDETFKSFTDDELNTHDFQINQKLEVIEQKIARLKAQKAQLLKWKDTIQTVRTQRRTNQQTERGWDDESYAWSANARETLKEVFGLSVFRPQQLQTINALMSGNDVLLLAPTGGGKSLCFQLPAVISEGVTVVISPLISLMEDQVWSLQKLGIEARMLSSSSEKADINEIHKILSSVKQKPSLKLLYITPERMAKSKRFMTALQKCYDHGHLDRFAIDEVHCCSQWGHDFRPDYKFLGVLKEMFPKAPLVGVTATATTKVITDVQKMLNIPEALVFVATFNRPNLYYHVLEKPQEKQEQYEFLSDLLLNRFRQKSGIIYTLSMKDAVDISTELQNRGLKVAPYHATLEAVDRTKIHQLWHKNDLQAVVATIAFGMGINKSDVRFVIHHTLSKSLENYYQESGRAGRDGHRAECILLYHFSDIFRISTMSFSEHTGLQNVYAMVEYCINVSDCRRKIISRYFSEVWGADDCAAMCDRCTNKEQAPHPAVDILSHYGQLKRVISKASLQQMKLTGLRLVDAWLHKGPTFLRLSEPPPPYERVIAEQVVAFLVINQHLKESFTYTPYATLSYLVLGLPIVGSSLTVRLGKHFDLPINEENTQTASEKNPASTTQTNGTKKRSLPTETSGKTKKNPSAKKGKTNATASKTTKRAKTAPTTVDDSISSSCANDEVNAPPATVDDRTISSTDANNVDKEANMAEEVDDDVIILPLREEIIEIDGD
ncbi:ATP-dependent DNA helicase Q1-like [Anopheles ziemanni]|uniref:ATP-dependent DNA helicase Q1-like n=1 Tax=Anopheles coustani TaxID=139045 RepID=UPI00265B6AAE|nr:ATP-dependent DNA helicase Q1-like [Anopheles coustani]XP_058171581.1 ATP-dependent DNA helicase Q1-like [Anopheles ziemanni]